MQMSAEAFDELADRVFEQLPPWVHRALDNVVIVVEERNDDDPDVLGLYDGVSLVDRGGYGTAIDGTVGVPDTITLYRRPLLEMCTDVQHLEREVRITIIHELAHHFGIEDERLDELGWG